MESDKELALRFKRIYKKKLKKEDFLGAYSAFVEATSLFPEIENANGMNALLRILSYWQCQEVNKMDWYSILEIPRDAEEDEVRNALEKLTCLVNSMKNKYPGVKIALEIMDEAGYLLCNRARRSDLNTFLDAKKKAVSCRVLQELEEEIASLPTSRSGPFYENENKKNDVPSEVSPKKRRRNWGNGDARPKKVAGGKSKDSQVSEEKSRKQHSKRQKDSTESNDDNGDEEAPPKKGGRTKSKDSRVSEEKSRKQQSKRQKDSKESSNGNGDEEAPPKKVTRRKSKDSQVSVETSRKQQSERQQDSTESKNDNGDEEVSSAVNMGVSLSPRMTALKNRIFAALPQDPHYLPVVAHYSGQVRESLRGGLDFGFVTVCDKIQRLNPKNFESEIDGLFEQLSQFEELGYNVQKLRQHLDTLRGIVDRHRASHVALGELGEYSRDKEGELDATEERVLGLEAENVRVRAEIEYEKKVVTKLQSDILNLRRESERQRKKINNLKLEFASASRSLW